MPLKHDNINFSCPAQYECNSPLGIIQRPSTFISIHKEEAPVLLTARNRVLNSSTGMARATYPRTSKKARPLRELTPKEPPVKFKSITEIVQQDESIIPDTPVQHQHIHHTPAIEQFYQESIQKVEIKNEEISVSSKRLSSSICSSSDTRAKEFSFDSENDQVAGS